jgi:hypothetical protein
MKITLPSPELKQNNMKIDHLSPVSPLVSLIFGVMLVSGFHFQASAQTQQKPFASLVSSDETNRYFEADLGQLPSFFDKAYFLELIFRDSVVVVTNSSLKNRFLPLLCNDKMGTKQVLLRIDDIKARVIRISESMSESEKAIIVKKFEKYR